MAGYHESIVERLQRAKGHWRVIARIADVPYQTLTKVAQNHSDAPRIDTIEKIENGLKQFERLRREVDREVREEFDREEFERLKQKLLAAALHSAKSRSRDDSGATA